MRLTYPDLTSGVTATATELNSDGCSTKVRSHREITDGKGSQADDGDLVEETGTPGLLWAYLSGDRPYDTE